MLDPPELGIVLKERIRIDPGMRQELSVGRQIPDPQTHDTVLCGADDISGPPEPQVLLGDIESAIMSLEDLEPGGRFARKIVRDGDAEGFVLTTADAAPELMQLRQTESIGVLDDHERCVGHVDTDLDDHR